MGLVNLVPARVIGPGAIVTAGGLKLLVSLPAGTGAGDDVEVAIRPENIRLSAAATGLASHHHRATFLGNINEYYASLDSWSDASGTDPSRAGLRGRRQGCHRGRCQPMQRISQFMNPTQHRTGAGS
jgi:hypothetical protein